MNEHPYNAEHLQKYTGILTSSNARNENFKIENGLETHGSRKEHARIFQVREIFFLTFLF